MRPHHPETHYIHKAGWLRAAVLGANDGLISTASLIVGVATAGASTSEILLAGASGLVAGAMSMAAGEYISVSSQSDIERADLEREAKGLRARPESELIELASIYMERGVERETAFEVARQLSDHDVLAAHARDELGIHDLTRANPLEAAITSAASFATGAFLPLLTVTLTPSASLIPILILITLALLALLGAISALIGGAPLGKPTIRVLFWGIVAMAFTSLIGYLFGYITE